MAWQGSMDGLCGPYSIVNAYHLCDIEEEWLGTSIFRIACEQITNWPDVLWEGTTFEQMRTMLKRCQGVLRHAHREADVPYSIKVKYPFRNDPPGTNKKLRKRFHRLFSQDDVICGIAGMESPAAHWFAFVYVQFALIVLDTAPAGCGGMNRIPLYDLRVPKKGKKGVVLNPEELIVFRDA